MHTNKLIFALILSFSLFYNSKVNSQNNNSSYTIQNSDSKLIINGIHWVNSTKYKNHRFCHNVNWKKGNIIFQNKLYTDLIFNYDIFKDELILFNRDGKSAQYIQLNKNFIKKFNYTEDGVEHNFKKINIVNKTCFVEELYLGKTSFYIVHKKKLSDKNEGKYLGAYLYKPKYYFKNKDIFFKISNKKSILNFLGHQTELKKYIRDNSLKIKTKYPDHIVKLLAYYEKLTNN